MCVQYVYQVLSLLLSWTSAGAMYLMMIIIFALGVQEIPISQELVYLFTLIYTFLTVLQLVAGLGADPKDMTVVYYISAWVYGMLMTIVLALGVYLLVTGQLGDFVALTGGFHMSQAS